MTTKDSFTTGSSSEQIGLSTHAIWPCTVGRT